MTTNAAGVWGPVTKKIHKTTTVDSNKKLQFGDTGTFIHQSSDGKLLISSDGVGNDDITLTGNVTVSDNLFVTGSLDFDTVGASGLDIDGTTTDAAAVDISQAGTGKTLRIDQNNTADTGIALEIDDEATGATNYALSVASLRTGTIANIVAEGDASTILAVQGSAAASSSRAVFINVDNTAGTDNALEIDDESTAAKVVLNCHATSTGTIALFDAETNAAQVVEIQSAGTGKGLLVDLNATGDSGIGFEIDDEATGTTNYVVKVASARTGNLAIIDAESANSGLVLELQNASTSGGSLLLDSNGNSASNVLEIDDEATSSSGNAFKIASARTGTVSQLLVEGVASVGQEFDTADGMTGVAVLIDHNETDGASVGLHIDVASTGTDAFVLKFTGSATNSGAVQTGSIGTDAAIDNMTAAIRVQVGSTTYYIPLLSTRT